MFCTELSLGQHLCGETEYRVLRCRNWTCSYCSGMRKRELIRLGEAGQPTSFITLTVSPHWFKDPDERARKLKAAWVTLRRKTMKKYGYSALPFLAVFEKTKLGEPHLHIAARCDWISQAWMADIMKAEIGAPVTWIERVKDQRQVANYVAKYISKDPQRFKGTKRYWTSRDWVLPSDEEEDDETAPNDAVWIESATLDHLESYFTSAGIHCRRSKNSLLATWTGGRAPPHGLRPDIPPKTEGWLC